MTLGNFTIEIGLGEGILICVCLLLICLTIESCTIYICKYFGHRSKKQTEEEEEE